MEPADAGCAGLVTTQGMIHVGVIAPTHFFELEEFSMINILMTDALVEAVNRYIKHKVLPIDTRWNESEEKGWRRPYASDRRISAGYMSCGQMYPLKEIGKLAVISNEGIPLFDGRGNLWLLKDGIAVVFLDASVYCVIHNMDLQQWLMTEIHNALLDEYTRVIGDVQTSSDVVNNAPSASDADVWDKTKVGNVYEIVELMVTGDETDLFDYDTMSKYFTPTQYCDALRKPFHGHELHYACRAKLMRNIFGGDTYTGTYEPLFPDTNGANLLAGNTDTIPAGHHAIYSRLQAESASFIHMTDQGGLGANINGFDRMVLDVFFVKMPSFRGAILRIAEQPTHWLKIEMFPDIISNALEHMHRFRKAYVGEEWREWADTNLLR